jgi:hypothetical protein
VYSIALDESRETNIDILCPNAINSAKMANISALGGPDLDVSFFPSLSQQIP